MMRRETKSVSVSHTAEVKPSSQKHQRAALHRLNDQRAALHRPRRSQVVTFKKTRKSQAQRRPSELSSVRKQQRNVAQQRAAKKRGPLKHSKSKLQAQQQRRVVHMTAKGAQRVLVASKEKQDVTPPSSAPKAGQERHIQVPSDFAKAFNIEFKVKLNPSTKERQELVTTDTHGLLIQALGSVFNRKIAAWIQVDSGLGPHGRGVPGSDKTGILYSLQTLDDNKWYDVKFKKTPTSVSLTVNGMTASSGIANGHTGVFIHDTDFDFKAGSTKIVSGKKAISGDYSIDGDIGDLTLTEGPE